MQKNNDYLQYVKSDENAIELFNNSMKTVNEKSAILNAHPGAIFSSHGSYDGVSLLKQAKSIGLTPCENFEGYTLYFNCGSILLRKEAPVSCTPGNVEMYGRVNF